MIGAARRALGTAALVVAGVAAHVGIALFERAVDWLNDAPPRRKN